MTEKKGSAASGTLGVALTILGGFFWGLSGACGQYMFQEKGATARWMVPIRLTIAGLLIVCYYIGREKKAAFRIWKKKRDVRDLLIYGLLGLMLCQYTYFQTIEYSNAGTATVIQYLSPVFILVIVCLMERRIPKPVEVTALVCAILGIFLIATHGDPTSMVISRKALGIGIFSAFTVVIYNMAPRRLLLFYPTPYLLGWGMVVGGVVLSLIFKPWSHPVAIDPELLAAFAAVILLGTICAFSLYMQGVKLIGPSRASLYACVEPIAAAVLSAVWLGVPFAPMDLLGFALIIATILMLGFADLKKGKRAEP